MLCELYEFFYIFFSFHFKSDEKYIMRVCCSQSLQLTNSNWLERLSSCFFTRHTSYVNAYPEGVVLSLTGKNLLNKKSVHYSKYFCVSENWCLTRIRIKYKSCMNTLILRGHNLSSFLSLGFMTGNISSC